MMQPSVVEIIIDLIRLKEDESALRPLEGMLFSAKDIVLRELKILLGNKHLGVIAEANAHGREKILLMDDVARCVFTIAKLEVSGDIKGMAAKRLARLVPVKLRNRAAIAALIRDAEKMKLPPSTVLAELLLPPAVILAIGEINRPQRLRLNKRWVTAENGKMDLVPLELSIGEFLGWLRKEVQRACETGLLERSYPAHEKDLFQMLSDLPEADVEDMLHRLNYFKDELTGEHRTKKAKAYIAASATLKLVGGLKALSDESDNHSVEKLDAEREVLKLKKRVSGKDRQLLEIVIEHYGGELLDALSDRGVKNDTIRQQRSRLRKKL